MLALSAWTFTSVENSVEESNENNNYRTYAFSVLAADLIIDTITWSPENPSTGTLVTFTVTMKNQGTKTAGCSHLDFFIDGNSRGYRYIPKVEAGASVTETFTWTAMSGTYTVKAVADILEQITESDETNNVKTAEYATAAPDLIISSITWTPASPTENTTVTFTATVKNQGNGKAESSNIKFYLDDVYQTSVFVGPLIPGATATKTFEWIAERMSLTLKAVIDADNWIIESDESNNAITIGLPTLAPDLIIYSITWSPSPPLIAHSTNFTVTVKNQGKSIAGFSRVYLYFDEMDGMYREIDQIAAGATVTRSFQWAPRKNSHILKAIIDQENYISESNESNNVMTKSLSSSPFTPTADLIVQSITVSPVNPSVGETVTVTVVIKNQGTGKANPSHVAYYIDDALLDSVYVDQINAGATFLNTFTWQSQAGSRNIRAIADINNAVPETNEANNERSQAIYTSGPDLIIRDVEWSPLIPAIGDMVTLTVTIGNRGDQKAGSSYVSYYVNDLYQGNHYVEEVNAGANITKTFAWQAQVEPHSLKAIIDKANAVAESDESNNEKIAFLPAPDLTISGIAWSPAEPSENTEVTVTVTIKNLGSGQSDNPYLYCYINDILQSKVQIGHVSPGDSVAGSFIWTAMPGEHVIRLVVDESDIITETEESNNMKAVNLSVSQQPAAVAVPSPAPPPESPPVTTTELEPPEEDTGSSVVIAAVTPEEETFPEVDIAGKLAEKPSPDSEPWWKKILMNRWLIIGIGVLGVVAIIVLLRFRKKKSQEA